MATLQYDISVIGANKLNAALAGIERRVGQHNRRVTGSPSPTAARRGVGAGAEAAHQKRLATIQAGHERRLSQQVLREKLSNENRLHQQKLRNIESEKEREIAAQRRANAAVARSRANTRGVVGGAAVRSVGGIGRGAVMAAGLGGTAIVAAGVQKQINIERQAAALANKAFGTPGETRGRQQIADSLLSQSRSIGSKTGNRAGVVEAIDKFVAISGSLKGGQAMAGFMADISDATGAEMGDVGRTGGQILQNIVATKGRDLSDPEQFQQSMREVEQILASMAGQAKIGSIEFSDLATQMGSVMSATSRFEGDVADLANQMGAIAQLAIAGGASSPEEAMTSIKRFSDDLVQNAARFDKMAADAGVKKSFFTDEGKTKLRDPTQIMMDILRTSKGDLTKVKKVFGIRAMKALEPFQQAYVSAKEKGLSDDEALAQVQGTIDRFKGASVSSGEITQSAAFARGQTGRSFQTAWENMTTEVGEELTPALKDLAPHLVKLGKSAADLAPYLSAFVRTLADNPIAGIGGIIAAKVTADIAQAAIGDAIRRKLLEGFDAPGGGGGVGGDGKGGAGGIGAAVATGAAIAGVATAAQEGAALAGNIAGGENQTGVGDTVASYAANILPIGWAAQAAGDILGGRNAADALLDTGGGKAVRGVGRLLGFDGGITSQDDLARARAGVNQAQAELDALRSGTAPAPKADDGMARASAKQEQAADKLSAAADKLSASSVQRGDKPSGGGSWFPWG